MMMYFKGFCQLKRLWPLALIVILSGCAKLPEAEIPVVNGKPVWFGGQEKYSFRASDGSLIVHPFFDLVPFSSEEDNSINFFMTIPAGSQYGYEFDLMSGKPYTKHRYCSQKDVWKGKLKINRPPFTIGIVPRLLDQLGKPQKIIVFGQGDYYRSFGRSSNPFSHRVRVVGGVVEKFCRKYPCVASEEWEARLVLVAVDPQDRSLRNIKTLAGLQKKVNWRLAKAFLENGNGRSYQGSKSQPAYKVSGNIEAKEALKFAINKGHLFKFNELRVMRANCEKLYDYVWETTKEIRDYMSAVKDPKAARAAKEALDLKDGKKKRVKSWNLSFEGDQANDHAGKLNHKSFSGFFKDLKVNYGSRLKVCSKFVRPSNIHIDQHRHWFFAYMFGFMKMEELGWIYLCNRKGWVENTFNQRTKKFLFDPIKTYRNCTDSELDYAFDTMPVVMAGYLREGGQHYRYMSYDARAGGTHEKLHTWVYEDAKELLCKNSLKRKQKFRYGKDNLDRLSFAKNKKKGTNERELIFPQDVIWQPFSSNDESLFISRE